MSMSEISFPHKEEKKHKLFSLEAAYSVYYIYF